MLQVCHPLAHGGVVLVVFVPRTLWPCPDFPYCLGVVIWLQIGNRNDGTRIEQRVQFAVETLLNPSHEILDVALSYRKILLSKLFQGLPQLSNLGSQIGLFLAGQLIDAGLKELQYLQQLFFFRGNSGRCVSRNSNGSP